ncbi:MAG: Na+/H+ antiporter NhaC family protein [Bacillus subtilis]|nr:Na+/H+ antiporter NhaC family protein [Bacillus subtilis]
MNGNFPMFLFPAVVFVLACIISFAAGTSWGTMGIMVPVALPIIVQLAKMAGHLPRGHGQRHGPDHRRGAGRRRVRRPLLPDLGHHDPVVHRRGLSAPGARGHPAALRRVRRGMCPDRHRGRRPHLESRSWP